MRVPRAAEWVPVALLPSDLLLCRCCQALLLTHLLVSTPGNVESVSVPVQSLVPFSQPASLKSAFAVTWASSLPSLCGTLQPSLCSGQTVLRSHGESPNTYPSPFSPLRHLAVPCCSVLGTMFDPLKLCLALGFCDPGPHLPRSRSSVTVPSLAAFSFPAF